MSERAARSEAQVQLVEGEPLIFGKERDKAVALEGLSPKIIKIESGDTESAIKQGAIVFDPSDRNQAAIISRLTFPEFPVPMGVLYKSERPTFDDLVPAQIEAAREKQKDFCSQPTDDILRDLFGSGDTWQVE